MRNIKNVITKSQKEINFLSDVHMPKHFLSDTHTINIRVSAHAQVPAPHQLSKKVIAASHTFVYNLLARVPAPNYFFTTFYSSPGGRDTDVYGN